MHSCHLQAEGHSGMEHSIEPEDCLVRWRGMPLVQFEGRKKTPPEAVVLSLLLGI